MKTYRPWAPRQAQLLPPSPLEWLPQGHLAYFILDVVEELDVSAVVAHYERQLKGQPPYHPRMMVALLLYGYCVGVASSRKLERKCEEDVAFRVLAGGQVPDHVCLSEFRRIHLEALSGLFLQVLKLCQKAGLVRLGHVALDGTKVKANASKHKAMSYERMQKAEAELKEKVAALLKAAEEADAQEDRAHGRGRRGDELPEELARAATRLLRIREARQALEQEAKAAHAEREEQKARERKEREGGDGPPAPPPPAGPTPLPHHQVQSQADGSPTGKAQRNFTDADSRIQKTSDGFVQGYNAQAAVDEDSQVIVAQALTNQPPDVEHLLPLLEAVVENCGGVPHVTTADAGFYSEANVEGAFALGVDVYIPPGRQKHGEVPPKVRGRPPKDMTVKEWMRRRLATKRGRAVYARRKATVEPVFGQTKEGRGLRRFLLRGLTKVRGEWALWCTTHNLLKLHRAAGLSAAG